MTKHHQGTLNRKVKFAGVGLHTGRIVNLEIVPCFDNTGIVFQRTDSETAKPVKAHPFNVTSTDLSTSIGSGESKISTIEHLMAAFAGLGIDNVLVLVDSPEIPILDGSSAPFIDKFMETGIERQESLRPRLVVKEAVEIRNGDQFIKIEPADGLSYHCSIDFKNSKAIGKQTTELKFNEENFLKLAEARTFCHIDDVNAMREVGLALGGSLDNAIVVDNDSVMNAAGLRNDNEFVEHKLLDCIGDLALLGGEIVGKVTLNKAGHKLHTQLASELLKNQETYISVDHNPTPKNTSFNRENGIEGLGLAAISLAKLS